MAKNVVVIGTQWGDEGKGKIVDWLTDHAAAVTRFKEAIMQVTRSLLGKVQVKRNTNLI
jgi:hypothetical protein